jgi:hypothetical protein
MPDLRKQSLPPKQDLLALFNDLELSQPLKDRIRKALNTVPEEEKARFLETHGRLSFALRELDYMLILEEELQKEQLKKT